MFSRDFTDIESSESFDTEWNLFSFISRPNECVPISSSLCVLKRRKLWLFKLVFLFLSYGPHTSTRKEIKYKFFIIILLYFRVQYSKTTKFLHL